MSLAHDSLDLNDPSRDSVACLVCGSVDHQLYCSYGEPTDVDRTWEVRRCPACGFAWTMPLLTASQISAYYEPAYLGDVRRTLDEYRQGSLQKTRSWRRETEKVQLLEQFCKGGTILDLGCAGASFLLALDPTVWKRVGVEFIGEVVAVVNEKVPDLDVHQGDIFSPSLQPASFDAITMWHVFEHLPDPRGILECVHSLLKPGGQVVISLPNFDSLQARWFRHHWLGFDFPRHLHHFSADPLETLLVETGFQPAGRLFFSKMVNIHHIKHSAIHWSEERFSSRIPYYALKPILMLAPLLEQWTGLYGTLTMVGRKGT